MWIEVHPTKDELGDIGSTGAVVAINLDHVTRIWPRDGGCLIRLMDSWFQCSDDYYAVTASLELATFIPPKPKTAGD